MRPLVVLAVVPLLMGSSASAPARRAVTIQFNLRFTVQEASSGSLAGSFQATGALTASGPVAENYVLSAPRLRGQQPVERVAGASTLNTTSGVLRVAYNGLVSSAAPDMTVTEGRWTITGASGSFHGLHGTGRFSAIVDLTKRTMVKRYDGLLESSRISLSRRRSFRLARRI